MSSLIFLVRWRLENHVRKKQILKLLFYGKYRNKNGNTSTNNCQNKLIYKLILQFFIAHSYKPYCIIKLKKSKRESMAKLKRFCCDDETGEVITYKINDETGEPAVIHKIPLVYSKASSEESNRKFVTFPGGYMSKTKKFQDLKAKILDGANTTSPRMFLIIPSLMIFPSLVCVLLMLLEIILHVRCHKKNKNLNDSNLYYRSPFHVITSTFCGFCRECDMASKIGQIQDKRRYHYDYLRGIAI